MAQLNFDASNVPVNNGYDVIPAGWYIAMIERSDLKPTKDASGTYLELVYKVLDGPYTNRLVFQRITMQNANQQATQIGHGQLSAVCHAVNVLRAADSSQLHNIPLKLKVKLRKDPTGQYEDQNEVSSVQNINYQVDMTPTASPVNPAAGFPPSAVPPMAAPAAPTWQTPAQAAPVPPAPPAAPAWQAPAAAPVPPAPAAAAPAAPVQPWQQPTAAPAAPAAPVAPAPVAAPAAPAAPGSGAVPPWQQPHA